MITSLQYDLKFFDTACKIVTLKNFGESRLQVFTTKYLWYSEFYQWPQCKIRAVTAISNNCAEIVAISCTCSKSPFQPVKADWFPALSTVLSFTSSIFLLSATATMMTAVEAVTSLLVVVKIAVLLLLWCYCHHCCVCGCLRPSPPVDLLQYKKCRLLFYKIQQGCL